MFAPEDPLKPPRRAFDEPWQAQVLAMADAMVRAGHFTAGEWAQALGTELQHAEAKHRPDTLGTYYAAALAALERLSASTGITAVDRDRRKAEWEAAYRRTPHGQPVLLKPGAPGTA